MIAYTNGCLGIVIFIGIYIMSIQLSVQEAVSLFQFIYGVDPMQDVNGRVAGYIDALLENDFSGYAWNHMLETEVDKFIASQEVELKATMEVLTSLNAKEDDISEKIDNARLIGELEVDIAQLPKKRIDFLDRLSV